MYIIFFVGMRPFEEYRKYRIELINEVTLMFVFYHMFCFSSFLPNITMQYYMGYSLCFFLIVMLYFNVKNIIDLSLIAYRRKKFLNDLHKRYTKYRAWKVMKENKTYKRMRTLEWRWKTINALNAGRLDLKMAYIEERKMFRI